MRFLRACFLAIIPMGLAATAAEEETLTVLPRDNGSALVNPGMGWVFHYYDNVPGITAQGSPRPTPSTAGRA